MHRHSMLQLTGVTRGNGQLCPTETGPPNCCTTCLHHAKSDSDRQLVKLRKQLHNSASVSCSTLPIEHDPAWKHVRHKVTTYLCIFSILCGLDVLCDLLGLLRCLLSILCCFLSFFFCCSLLLLSRGRSAYTTGTNSVGATAL